MRFMIAVDCDGAACVVGQPGRTLSDSGDFEFAKAQATREADAAVRALFDAGAKGVVVWDNHGSGANLAFDRLDARCEIVLGTGFRRRWPGLDGAFAGVVMVGYHAMEVFDPEAQTRRGTRGGVLAHTYSHPAVRWIKVNGQPVGELALDAAVAGELGVPAIFVSSDACGCQEARSFLPWIEAVVTKDSRGRNAAFSQHPARACEAIYTGIRRAVGRLGEMKPFAFPAPLEMELRFKRVSQAVKARLRWPGWRLAGPHTIRRRFDDLSGWSGPTGA